MALKDKSETRHLLGGLIDMPRQHIVRIVLLGAAIGMIGFTLTLLMREVIFEPIFCGDMTAEKCTSPTDTANTIAMIIMSLAGLLGLVRLSVYRPLLIVIAVDISLWNIGSLTIHLPWYEALAWWGILYACCYLFFSWLVRPRAFLPTVLLVVVAVTFIRWLPSL